MSRTGIDQISTVQMPGEQVFFGPSKSGKFKVVLEPNIKSKADLEQYIQRAHQRRSLAIQKGGSTIGVITTKAPLTFQRIEELEHKYALTIGGVKIRSSNGGTVFSRWPPDLQWLDGLQQNLAAKLKKHLRPWLSRNPSSPALQDCQKSAPNHQAQSLLGLPAS